MAISRIDFNVVSLFRFLVAYTGNGNMADMLSSSSTFWLRVNANVYLLLKWWSTDSVRNVSKGDRSLSWKLSFVTMEHAISCKVNTKNMGVYTMQMILKTKNIRLGGGSGEQTAYRIVMKFCAGVGIPDVIIHADFGDHRFRGFGEAGIESALWTDLRCHP